MWGDCRVARCASAAIALLLVALCADASPVIVATTYGPVEGRVERQARVWRGIPYAAPPVPRFLPPSPPAPWTQTRPAFKFGASCVQAAAPGPFSYSEDCLFLNVYAPLETPASPAPVIVWVHGGGLQVGQGDPYDASVLVSSQEQPVVVVTINYRLNAFGWFFLRNSTANLGFLDQRFALTWVRDNIGAFGGDPKRVTIMGESAGSVSAFLHLVEKPSWPLFSAAIAESGGPGIWPTKDEARATFESFAASFGCSDLACMQAVPAEKLLPHDVMGRSPFVYVWDSAVIPYQPQTMVARSLIRPNTPVLVGTNAVETSFFSWLYLNMSLTPPTQPQFDSIIQSQMALYSAEAQEVARANYPFDPANATRNWINVGAPVIDLLVVCAEQFAAEALPTAFRYHWDVAPANYVLESIFHLGATHTCEVPFFFGTGSVFYFKFTAKEEPLAASTVSIVRQFAASGTAPWPPGNVTRVFRLEGVEDVPSRPNPMCERWRSILLGKN